MNEPLFQPASFFFIRTPSWPIEYLEPFLKAENWQESVLKKYDESPFLQEAILLASPNLYHSLQKEQPERKESALSLLKYIYRCASRATPFGIFAYVALGQINQSTDCKVNLEQMQKRVRPDCAWLYHFIDKLYACEDENEFLDRQVIQNPFLEFSHHRIYLSFLRQAEKQSVYKNEKQSVVNSTLIRQIFKHTKKGVTIKHLLQLLQKDFTALDADRALNLTKELFTQQFLVPNILPSVLQISKNSQMFSCLNNYCDSTAINQTIKEYSKVKIGKGIEPLKRVHQNMSQPVSSRHYLQVDAYDRHSLSSLPHHLAAELSQGIEMLWKITAATHQKYLLQSYHRRFLDKFGLHRTVSVSNLLDPEKGLGIPEIQFYQDESKENPFAAEWKKWLHQAWQTALVNDQSEIQITKKDFDRLLKISKVAKPNFEEALLSTDIFFRISAQSEAAIDQGQYQLILNFPTLEGGNSYGRFLDFLPDQFHQNFKAFIDKEENLEEKHSVC